MQHPVKYHIKKEGWDNSELHKFDFWPSEAPSLIIEVFTSNGLIGLGEAVVTHWYYGNTLEHNIGTMKLYERRLENEDPENLNRIHRLMDSVIGHGSQNVKASQDALVTALLDIVGQVHDEPIYNLLGGAYQTEFELMTNLYLADPKQMADQAVDYAKRGYTGLKIKCGTEVEEHGWSLPAIEKDVEKLTATLETVPKTIYVDGDCNQAWGPAHRAVSIIRSHGLEKYGNFAIEQPVGYFDLTGASEVARSVSVPVILDESVMSPEILVEIIRREAAGRIVVKPSRVGGLIESQKIVNLAEAAKIGVSLDNSPCSMIGDAALCHLGATVKEPYPICADLYTWLKENPVKKPGISVEGGRVKIISSRGLGMELNKDVLEEIEIKT